MNHYVIAISETISFKYKCSLPNKWSAEGRLLLACKLDIFSNSSHFWDFNQVWYTNQSKQSANSPSNGTNPGRQFADILDSKWHYNLHISRRIVSANHNHQNSKKGTSNCLGHQSNPFNCHDHSLFLYYYIWSFNVPHTKHWPVHGNMVLPFLIILKAIWYRWNCIPFLVYIHL